MANTGAIKAGRAFVELFADESKLVRGLRRAEKRLRAYGDRVRGIGLRVTAAGAALAAPLVASTRLFGQLGDQLNKMSIRTGFSAEALSELGFAAEQSGADLQTLEVGVRTMQRSIRDAERGLSTAVDALGDLGLSVADLQGLSPEKQFKLIADRVSQIADPTIRAAVAMQLLGRGGQKLLPLLASGAAGIEQLQAQARALGLTISTEAAADAAKFTDQMNILWKVVRRGVFAIGEALGPVITELGERITGTLVATANWIRQNKSLVVTVAKVAAITTVVGGSLLALGVTISAAGIALGGIATVITGVVGAAGLLASAIAALASPVGIAIATVTALGATLLHVTGVGGKTLAWLSDRFVRLKDDATATFRGVGDALAAGDIVLAARVLWLGLKLQWDKGVAAITGAWLSFKQAFLEIANKAFYGALAAAEMAWHGLEVAFIETTAFMSRVWHGFTAGFQKAWNSAINWTAKRLLELQGLMDSGFDVRGAKDMADQELASTNARIDRDRDAALASAEERRERRRRTSGGIHEQTMAVIGRQYEEARAGLAAEIAAQRDEAETALAQARKEWEDAVAAAAEKRRAVEQGSDGPDIALATSADELLDQLASLTDVARRTIEVRGTFNAAAAQGLASGGPEERIADATEQTARNTRRMERQLQSMATSGGGGGLTFA